MQNSYSLDGNALLEFYLEKENFPVKNVNKPTCLALEEFSIEDLNRVNEEIVSVRGSLLVLVNIEDTYKAVEQNITIPILYSAYDQFGRKQELSKQDFEKELNNFKDDFEQVKENLTLVTGKVAEDMWLKHMSIKKNVFPEDAKKYPEIPERIRVNLETTFKKYTKNKAFKERYDKLYQRFVYLSKELAAKYPNDIILTNYKGMPVLYLKGEQDFKVGKHRIYMTPVSCYSISKDGYIRKFYDLSIDSIKQSLVRFSSLDAKYFVCSERLVDLKNVLNDLNLRKKLSTEQK